MQALAASTGVAALDLVRMWERASALPPVARALSLLESSGDCGAGADLAALSIGERDARLLALRELLFGPRLCSLADCPGCGQGVEFVLDASGLREHRAAPHPQPLSFTVGETVIHYRLVDSRDLAALAGSSPDVRAARRLLASRCVLNATRGGLAIDSGKLPEEAVEQLSERLAEVDPQADIEIVLSCPRCALSWSAAFDIASFLWQEIGVRVRQLLADVHTLAWAYGWHESDILAMSDIRRRQYLGMLQ